ncbi:unnamed protein product [Sphagnum balticum]
MDQKGNATPMRHKQVDKTKDAVSPLVLEYHQVSHSQRVKVSRGDFLMQLLGEGGVKREERDARIRQKIKSNYETVEVRLAEISENPENIKMLRNHSSSNRSSSHNPASPPCFGKIFVI